MGQSKKVKASTIAASKVTASQATDPKKDLAAPTVAQPVDTTVNSGSSQNSYADRTERIQAITQLIKTLQPFIWAIVLAIVLIPLAGKYIIDQSLVHRVPDIPEVVQEVAVTAPDWSEVDRAIADSLQTAHGVAETYASQALTQWEAELEPRIENFLDWYFDFFNQKRMEFSTPFVWGYGWAIHRMDPKQPSGKEAVITHLSESFEKEFSKRVLVPKNAQLRLEVITNQTVDQYLAALRESIGAVQTKYHIPQGQWDRYLSDISLTLGSEGTVSSLSLKTLAGGGTYLAAKPIVMASLGKLGSKASAKFAGAAASKVAAKTGGAVAAELGAAALDPIVGLGILAWDVWDYRHTVEVDRPVLRDNLATYLQDVKQVLLNHPDSGVMTAIRQIEQDILAAL